MRKNLAVIALLAGALSGCATGRMPLNGFAYSNVQAGLNATASKAGTMQGEACAFSVLSLVALGDASIETARRNGGISLITSVDESFTTILGVYSRYCTIAYGR